MIESEELSQILWKRIQSYLSEFDVPEETCLQDLHIHGVPYLLRGKWQPIGLNKVKYSHIKSDMLMVTKEFLTLWDIMLFHTCEQSIRYTCTYTH